MYFFHENIKDKLRFPSYKSTSFSSSVLWLQTLNHLMCMRSAAIVGQVLVHLKFTPRAIGFYHRGTNWTNWQFCLPTGTRRSQALGPITSTPLSPEVLSAAAGSVPLSSVRHHYHYHDDVSSQDGDRAKRKRRKSRKQQQDVLFCNFPNHEGLVSETFSNHCNYPCFMTLWTRRRLLTFGRVPCFAETTLSRLKRGFVHFTKGAFDLPYSGIRMRKFTSKNHVYENFDIIGIQRRFAASFPDKISLINRPPFSSKEKYRGYSVYSYSRIGPIERTLSVLVSSESVLRNGRKCTLVDFSVLSLS